MKVHNSEQPTLLEMISYGTRVHQNPGLLHCLYWELREADTWHMEASKENEGNLRLEG